MTERPPPSDDTATIRELGDALRSHASRINRHTARMLDDVSRFEAMRGWKHYGARSCIQWLCAHCNLGFSAAGEYKRVAIALRQLPLIRASFGKGEISYSKVRALTRVATPEHEADLLEWALDTPAHVLEKDISRMRLRHRLDAAGLADRSEAELARYQFERRSVTWHWREHDGCLHLKAILPPEDGARLLDTLQRESALMEEAQQERALGEEATAPGMASTLRVDPATGEPVPDPDTTSGFDEIQRSINDQVGLATAAQRRADALTAFGDAWHTDKCRGYSDKRHQVTLNVDYAMLAESAAFITPHAADDRTDATGTADSRDGGCGGGRHAHEQLPPHRQPRAFLQPGGAVSRETAQRLCCDASINALVMLDGNPMSIGRGSRVPPVPMRKAVLSRDSHRCSFPGCGAEHHLEMHHITPWYQDPRAGPPGETGVDNLMTLCSYHHRLLHEGGYSARQVGRSGKWQVQFFGPDGLPLPV